MITLLKQLAIISVFSTTSILKNPRVFLRQTSQRIRIALKSRNDANNESGSLNSSSFHWQKFHSSEPQGSRILMFLTSCPPYTNSGYTIRSHEILKALHKRNLEITPVTRLGYPAVIGRLARAEATQHGLIQYTHLLPSLLPISKRRRGALATKMLVKLARTHSVQVLHTTTDFENGEIVRDVAKLLNLPWIYEIRGERHNTWLSQFPSCMREAKKRDHRYQDALRRELSLANSADAVIVLSQVSSEKWQKLGVPASKIHVVPNSVDSTYLGKTFDRYSIRDKLGLPQERILFGSVSSIVDYEGFSYALEALSYLPNQFHFVLVGRGQAEESLKRLAHELGVIDRVTFAGPVQSKQAWEYYAAFDCFVMPRIDAEVCRDVTPLKPLIAMALDIPVVASDLPALREVTGNEASYCQPEDAKSLALAIQETVTSEHVSKIEFVRARSWEKAAATINHIYDELLTRANS